MARLRAVVVIHAPGLSGMPRVGHVSRAVMNASWTASSARSKSPRTRMSVATARPCSSRNRRSTTSWAARSLVQPATASARPAPVFVGSLQSTIGRISMDPCSAPGIIAA